MHGKPQEYIDVETISDLHTLFGWAKPKHPLVSLVDIKSDKQKQYKGRCFFTGLAIMPSTANDLTEV